MAGAPIIAMQVITGLVEVRGGRHDKVVLIIKSEVYSIHDGTPSQSPNYSFSHGGIINFGCTPFMHNPMLQLYMLS